MKLEQSVSGVRRGRAGIQATDPGPEQRVCAQAREICVEAVITSAPLTVIWDTSVATTNIME